MLRRAFLAPAFVLPLLSPPALAAEASATLDLDSAYRGALLESERIEIARRRLDEAELEPWRVATRMAPRAGIGAVWTREKEEIALESGGARSLVRPRDAWSGELVATQPLLEAEVFPGWESAEATVAQVDEEYGAEVRDLLYEVAVTYHEVLRSEERLRVVDEQIELASREVDHAAARYDAGSTLRTDVLRAEVERGRAEQARVRVLGQRDVARRTLAQLTGAPPDVALETPPEPVPVSLDPEELTPVAYTSRAELRALERAAEAADADRREVWARFLPDVQAAWRYPKLEEPTFAEPDGQWTFTLELALPIFEGGERIVDLRQARSRQTRAELAIDELRDRVRVELERATTRVRSELETAELVEREVQLASESYRIASDRYAAGAATSLEVLTALDDLARARSARVDNVHDLAIARLALERTVGTFADDWVARLRSAEEE